MVGNICALTLHDKGHPACKVMQLIGRSFGFPRLFFTDNYKPENHYDAITNVYHVNHRCAYLQM